MRYAINKLFLEHPTSVGESYLVHLATASTFAARMIFGGCACFIHGVFPFLCVKTGSAIIRELNHSMVTHRSKTELGDNSDRQDVDVRPLG